MYLSDNAIKKAKPLAKLYKMKDGEGLFLHVQPNGTKRFVLAYRYLGKQKSLALGVYPHVSLAEARRGKEEAKALLAKGIDPSVWKRAEQTQVDNADKYVFSNLLECWWDFWKQGKRENTIKGKRIRINKHVLPYLYDRRIDEIKRIELVEIINRIVKDGSLETASKVSTTIGMIFDYAVNAGYIEYSPAQKLSSVIPSFETVHLPGITDPQDLGVLLKAIYSENFFNISVGYALRILPYVFVRPSELRLAAWSEFDLDKGEWAIPADRMKMKRPHFVPLSRQIVGLLRELYGFSGNSGIVFPSPVGKGKFLSDAAFRVALLRLGYSKEEVTPHGFRTTASTLLHEMGFDSRLIEMQLAHKDENKIRATYNQAEFRAERIHLMQKWSDYLDSLRLD